MSYSSAVPPDERKRIEEMMEADLLLQGDAIGVVGLSRQCSVKLFKEWEDGTNTSSEQLIRALAVDGLMRHASRVIKSDRASIKVKRTNRIVNLSSRRGVRRTDENGVPQPGWEQKTYWEMPWAVFVQHVADMVRQRDNLSLKVTGFREILTLRDKYPDTKTPAEACEIEGIDPRRFGMEDREKAA